MGLPYFRTAANNERMRKLANVFEKTDRGEELVECEDADGMFQKLNI